MLVLHALHDLVRINGAIAVERDEVLRRRVEFLQDIHVVGDRDMARRIAWHVAKDTACESGHATDKLALIFSSILCRLWLGARAFQTGIEKYAGEKVTENTTAKIATEKSALEERVRVLERIVTSRGYTVAEEIEELRRAPAIADTSADLGTPLNLNTKENQS